MPASKPLSFSPEKTRKVIYASLFTVNESDTILRIRNYSKKQKKKKRKHFTALAERKPRSKRADVRLRLS